MIESPVHHTWPFQMKREPNCILLLVKPHRITERRNHYMVCPMVCSYSRWMQVPTSLFPISRTIANLKFKVCGSQFMSVHLGLADALSRISGWWYTSTEHREFVVCVVWVHDHKLQQYNIYVMWLVEQGSRRHRYLDDNKWVVQISGRALRYHRNQFSSSPLMKA